ncbi:allophanate hydrolase [Nocardioides sp. Root190]|uniref:5-oxoprolinase subunit B family protein n=1 Tax=Nocardioides sp. Root190 TaxID=1736488 RepID=UPI0006F50960|nr:allophanate hydrolase subunit 1 [Nocardioides sp. Root190]KRB76068.1 allophanate hydrolase [Nocardioides sp. Root190]
MKVLPYGDRGLLVELADTDAVVRCVALIRSGPATSGLVADVVPGARTVLVVARAGVPIDLLRAVVPDEKDLMCGESPGHQGPPPAEVVIPVRYDGPDLERVAGLTGLTEAEVVAAHTGTPWRVAFGGFAPGFAYLVGGDPRLQVPRREQPRTTVPAGAVGLAGEFSGIYPRSSPGGWQLVGRTDRALWDLDRDPPALLGAGVTVRFEEVP